MDLKLLPGSYAICRMKPDQSPPSSIYKSDFYSISKSEQELSIVCESQWIQEDCKIEKGWSLIKVVGPLDFNQTGILASLVNPLAEAKISLFAISTYDTDYLLIKTKTLKKAQKTLEQSGASFI